MLVFWYATRGRQKRGINVVADSCVNLTHNLTSVCFLIKKKMCLTLPTKSDMLKVAMMRMGSHSPKVEFLISDSRPGNRHRVML